MVETTFRWLSPLGASTALFLLIGFLWILIGALAVPLVDRELGPGIIFVSSRTDKAYFGGEARELLRTNHALAKLRTLLITVIAGFLLLARVAFMAMAWFGVRRRQLWTVNALGIGAVLVIVIWGVALLPYVRANITLTLGDLPPFMWVPSLLILPAVVLGWIGISAA